VIANVLSASPEWRRLTDVVASSGNLCIHGCLSGSLDIFDMDVAGDEVGGGGGAGSDGVRGWDGDGDGREEGGEDGEGVHFGGFVWKFGKFGGGRVVVKLKLVLMMKELMMLC
jgi:hypothetical protein